MMFAPDICLPALRAMHALYGERIYGRYGFADAFNPNSGWVDTDVIGIDVGISLLSAENLRSGRVWKWVSRNGEIGRALRRAGFVPAGRQGGDESHASLENNQGRNLGRPGNGRPYG